MKRKTQDIEMKLQSDYQDNLVKKQLRNEFIKVLTSKQKAGYKKWHSKNLFFDAEIDIPSQSYRYGSGRVLSATKMKQALSWYNTLNFGQKYFYNLCHSYELFYYWNKGLKQQQTGPIKKAKAGKFIIKKRDK